MINTTKLLQKFKEINQISKESFLYNWQINWNFDYFMIFWQMIRTYNGPTAKRPNWVKVAVVSWKSLYSRHDVYGNVHLYSGSS